MLRVLGIDPGMQRLGLALVTMKDGSLALGPYALIANPRTSTEKFNKYLNKGIQQIANEFPVALSLMQPHVIVSETVPTGRLGSNSELVVAAITTCKVIAFQWGIPWKDLGANSIKKNFVDDGKASKTKIRNKVIEVFPSIGEKHTQMKKESKARGEKPLRGLDQDVFDAIATAVVGVNMLHENNGRSKNKDIKRNL